MNLSSAAWFVVRAPMLPRIEGGVKAIRSLLYWKPISHQVLIEVLRSPGSTCCQPLGRWTRLFGTVRGELWPFSYGKERIQFHETFQNAQNAAVFMVLLFT
jgi:hypothetical protein